MIWSLIDIQRARHSYVEALVDEERLFPPGAMEGVRSYLAKQLQEEMAQHGLKIHLADVQIMDRTADLFRRQIRARWQPSTQEVQLVGGPQDGKVMTLTGGNLFHPLIFPVMVPVPMFTPEGPPPAAVLRDVTYDYCGWSDTERRWVYGMDGVIPAW